MVDIDRHEFATMNYLPTKVVYFCIGESNKSFLKVVKRIFDALPLPDVNIPNNSLGHGLDSCRDLLFIKVVTRKARCSISCVKHIYLLSLAVVLTKLIDSRRFNEFGIGLEIHCNTPWNHLAWEYPYVCTQMLSEFHPKHPVRNGVFSSDYILPLGILLYRSRMGVG